jgi:hypothetical protein
MRGERGMKGKRDGQRNGICLEASLLVRPGMDTAGCKAMVQGWGGRQQLITHDRPRWV